MCERYIENTVSKKMKTSDMIQNRKTEKTQGIATEVFHNCSFNNCNINLVNN